LRGLAAAPRHCGWDVVRIASARFPTCLRHTRFSCGKSSNPATTSWRRSRLICPSSARRPCTG
jgi:hypothetical protein